MIPFFSLNLVIGVEVKFISAAGAAIMRIKRMYTQKLNDPVVTAIMS
jgi:hypothetical protein